jgi:Ca2+-binding EF-hand superfamily protein
MADGDESHPLHPIFRQLDVDGDGYLSREDLTEALASIGLSITVDEIFLRLDPSDTGMIDFDQFIDGASLFTGGGGGDNDTEDDDEEEEHPEAMEGTENMRSIFRLVDADGDGFITFDQLGDAVSHVVGRVLGPSELGQLKTAFGGASDAISMQTFTTVMQQFTGAGEEEDEDVDDDDGGGNSSPGMTTPAFNARIRRQSSDRYSLDTAAAALAEGESSLADVLAESTSIKKRNRDMG